MAVYKCKACGAPLEVKEGENLFKSPKGEPVFIIQVGRDGQNIAIPNFQFNELGQITKLQYNIIKTENIKNGGSSQAGQCESHRFFSVFKSVS